MNYRGEVILCSMSASESRALQALRDIRYRQSNIEQSISTIEEQSISQIPDSLIDSVIFDPFEFSKYIPKHKYPNHSSRFINHLRAISSNKIGDFDPSLMNKTQTRGDISKHSYSKSRNVGRSFVPTGSPHHNRSIPEQGRHVEHYNSRSDQSESDSYESSDNLSKTLRKPLSKFNDEAGSSKKLDKSERIILFSKNSSENAISHRKSKNGKGLKTKNRQNAPKRNKNAKNSKAEAESDSEDDLNMKQLRDEQYKVIRSRNLNADSKYPHRTSPNLSDSKADKSNKDARKAFNYAHEEDECESSFYEETDEESTDTMSASKTPQRTAQRASKTNSTHSALRGIHRGKGKLINDIATDLSDESDTRGDHHRREQASIVRQKSEDIEFEESSGKRREDKNNEEYLTAMDAEGSRVDEKKNSKIFKKREDPMDMENERRNDSPLFEDKNDKGQRKKKASEQENMEEEIGIDRTERSEGKGSDRQSDKKDMSLRSQNEIKGRVEVNVGNGNNAYVDTQGSLLAKSDAKKAFALFSDNSNNSAHAGDQKDMIGQIDAKRISKAFQEGADSRFTSNLSDSENSSKVHKNANNVEMHYSSKGSRRGDMRIGTERAAFTDQYMEYESPMTLTAQDKTDKQSELIIDQTLTRSLTPPLIPLKVVKTEYQSMNASSLNSVRNRRNSSGVITSTPNELINNNQPNNVHHVNEEASSEYPNQQPTRTRHPPQVIYVSTEPGRTQDANDTQNRASLDIISTPISHQKDTEKRTLSQGHHEHHTNTFYSPKSETNMQSNIDKLTERNSTQHSDNLKDSLPYPHIAHGKETIEELSQQLVQSKKQQTSSNLNSKSMSKTRNASFHSDTNVISDSDTDSSSGLFTQTKKHPQNHSRTTHISKTNSLPESSQQSPAYPKKLRNQDDEYSASGFSNDNNQFTHDGSPKGANLQSPESKPLHSTKSRLMNDPTQLSSGHIRSQHEKQFSEQKSTDQPNQKALKPPMKSHISLATTESHSQSNSTAHAHSKQEINDGKPNYSYQIKQTTPPSQTTLKRPSLFPIIDEYDSDSSESTCSSSENDNTFYTNTQHSTQKNHSSFSSIRSLQSELVRPNTPEVFHISFMKNLSSLERDLRAREKVQPSDRKPPLYKV